MADWKRVKISEVRVGNVVTRGGITGEVRSITRDNEGYSSDDHWTIVLQGGQGLISGQNQEEIEVFR